jgi:hypothetical protein
MGAASPHRHCERSEAIQAGRVASKGWIASSLTLLAMTVFSTLL